MKQLLRSLLLGAVFPAVQPFLHADIAVFSLTTDTILVPVSNLLGTTSTFTMEARVKLNPTSNGYLFNEIEPGLEDKTLFISPGGFDGYAHPSNLGSSISYAGAPL